MKKYTAYDQRVALVECGERYEEREASGEPDWQEDFDTLEEARAWADERAEKLARDGEGFNVVKTAHGLDTVEYHDVRVDAVELDEDGDEVGLECVYAVSALPGEIRKAARESERSYWRYLDYSADEYHGL